MISIKRGRDAEKKVSVKLVPNLQCGEERTQNSPRSCIDNNTPLQRATVYYSQYDSL